MHHLTFETSLGTVCVTWTDHGIKSVQLPESPRAKGQLTGPAGTPTWVSAAVSAIAQHLETGDQDLSAIPLDLPLTTPFIREVYNTLRQVPPGYTVTYGQLAARAGSPGAARAVGQALARNPVPLLVPCHRVLAAGGKLGGFSASGGLTAKARLLRLEGVKVSNQ